LIKRQHEKLLSQVAFYTIGINLITSVIFIFYWVSSGCNDYNIKDLSLYKDKDYNFFLDFFFDRVTAIYFLTGNIISFMVVVYSRYYMHKESGYNRFFNTILFFYSGYVITIFAGNFETLFIGWEILGISSFLLMAFYRKRY